METLNMYKALLDATERKATKISRAEGNIDKEKFWHAAYKNLQCSIENVLSQLPDDQKTVDAIRNELCNVITSTFI